MDSGDVPHPMTRTLRLSLLFDICVKEGSKYSRISLKFKIQSKVPSVIIKFSERRRFWERNQKAV
jgi:hypothetical protein